LRAVTHSVSQKPCRMNGGVRHGSLGEPRTTEVLCCVRVSTSVWRRRKKARGRWVALSGAAVIASRWIRRPGLWKTKHVPRRGSWSTRAVGEVCLHAVCFSKPVRQSQRHQRVRHVDEMASYSNLKSILMIHNSCRSLLLAMNSFDKNISLRIRSRIA
jgi:hypothetical protein